MGNSATLVVRIISDAKGATAGVDAAANRFGRVGDAARRAMVPATALGVGLLAGAKRAVDAASRTQQAFGGLDAVFGRNAAQMKRWAEGAANSVGLAKSEYGELATLIGSQLKNAGVPMAQLGNKTNSLIKTGADLAAMYGGTTREAVEALSSALKGEFDPMERYGTSLSATAIKAEMVAQGTDKLTGKQQQAAKAQATLALITKQTADAQGASAREYDSAASAQQRMNAQIENMSSDLGTVLLPVVSMFADVLAKVATFAGKNATAVQILAAALAGLVVAVYAVNGALAVYRAAMVVGAAVNAVLRGSLIATRVQLLALAVAEKIAGIAAKITWRSFLGPVGLIIAAVALIAAGFVLLYKKSSTFRKIVDTVWSAIKRGATAAGNLVKRVWNAVWSAVSAYVRAYLTAARFVFNAIRSAVRTVTSWAKAAWRALWTAAAAYVRTYIAIVRSVISAVRSIISSVASFIRNAFRGAWSAITSAARSAGAALKSPFTALESVINGVIHAVESLIGWLGRIHVPKISLPKVGGLLGRSAPVATSATTGFATPGFRAAVPGGTVRRTAAGGGVVIQVTGALDPEAVARQIQKILARHDRRIGVAT